jgi:hypothetical protein
MSTFGQSVDITRASQNDHAWPHLCILDLLREILKLALTLSQNGIQKRLFPISRKSTLKLIACNQIQSR